MPVTFPTLDPDSGELIQVDYFTIGEVADMFHVSHSTVRRRIKSGEWSFFSPIPGAYFMSPAHVAEVVRRNTHPAEDPPPAIDGTPPPARLGTPMEDKDLEGLT